MGVMEQFECFFKIEVTIPLKQLRAEEDRWNPSAAAEVVAVEAAVEEAAPKKKGLLSKMWGLANVLAGKKS